MGLAGNAVLARRLAAEAAPKGYRQRIRKARLRGLQSVPTVWSVGSGRLRNSIP